MKKGIRMMKKRVTKDAVISFGISVVLAAGILLLTDAAVVFCGGLLSLPAAVGLLVGLTLLLFLLCRRHRKQVAAAACVLLVLLSVAAVITYGCWNWFSRNGNYQSPDAGKNQIYGGRKVMLIVPHQDDDINILGGVMEEYVRYGSDLYGVFITNGDYAGLAETRYREAVSVFAEIGVPEDHVIFLGYGDGWQEGGPHIYNAESGAVMTSYFGQTGTYGTKEHPAYREGREYTIDNLTEDLKSVILEYRPDVLFCSDYDHHIDHKATTLLFDKVMGQILKENPEYRPTVYKAYAYGTAWEAEPDYYGENVLSTQDLFAEPYSQKPAVYRWEDRVRFPVDGTTLSRSLMGSRAYQLLEGYTSQGAQWQAAGVVNGDKVAWQRQTESLCLTAEIDATSGNGALLNDFMLIENRDLVDTEHQPYDGVWMPDRSDSEKEVSVTLAEPSDISSIVLYDHPSEEHNILNAIITFDDGTAIKTGPLDPGGAATEIVVDRKDVAFFSVSLLETEGEAAGLSEIEAFAQEPRQDGRFIKLTDEDGNFLYDYLLPADGQADLSLYIYGDLPKLAGEHYTIGISGEKGTAVLENGVIRVSCPAGESFVLNVTCDAAGVSDTITIRNPGTLERNWLRLWQTVEERIYSFLRERGPDKLLPVRTLDKLTYKLQHGL